MPDSLAAYPDRFLFVITHDTFTYTGEADVLGPEHLRPLDHVRCFGKGGGHPGEGTRFRLYDDDGNLYFQGIQWDDGSGAQAFAPLDWGMNQSGCTTMQVYAPTGAGDYAWEVL